MRGPRLLLPLIMGVMLCLACAPSRHTPSVPAGVSECGPGLTDAEVIASAKRALRVMWGREPDLDHYRVSVQGQGCNYVFVAAQLGTEAREDIIVIVDRAGRVKTIPVCCDLGDCPELCKPAEDSAKPQR